MAGRNLKPGSGGFDSSDKVNSNTLKRHPKMDLSRNDLLQLLSYLEGELQARDVVIATLKAEKAKQLLYQAKYGRFGLGDPFSAMQRDSDNMKDNTFDESAIKSMYDNQLAQLENLIATQRKAQMKMREQMLTGEKRYQKVCSELDDEKRKHAQDTAQGDDVTYMLEKERERLKQEVDFEKANTKKMEKDLKKTLVNLEEERASSAKHKQVALMLIKERKKLVEKMIMEKQKADQAEKLLHEERNKAMNMAEGLVQESKKSLKMEATMERQLSEFDLEREQMKNKLQREENRTKDLQLQLDSLKWQVENLQKQSGKLSKEPTHSVEIKSNVSAPHARLSSERTPTWQASGSSVTNMLSNTISGKSNPMKLALDTNAVEREAGLSPRHSSSELSVRKRDNTRYASPQPVSIERSGSLQYSDNNLETRVAPVGAVSDKSLTEPQSVQKLNVSGSGGSTIVSSGGRITVQTGSPTPTSGPVSPRRAVSIGRGVPPPIPPNKPVLPATTLSKSSTTKVGAGGSKSVHIPVSVVHTTSVSTTPGNRASKREGSPSTLRKPAQLSDCQPLPEPRDATPYSPNSDSFDFLGPEMADLQQLLVSMVTDPQDSSGMNNSSSSISSSSSQTDSVSLSSSSSSELAAKTSSVEIIDSSTSASLFVQTPPLTSQYQVPDISLPPETSPTSMPVTSSPVTSGISRLSFTQSALLTKSLDFTSQSSKSVAESGQSSSLTKSLDFSTPLPSNPFGSSLLLQRSTVPGITIPSLKPIVSVDTPTSPIHRYAAIGNIESLRKLIVDLEADVNLPMKDGTTPTHCAAENGRLDCLQLLIERRCNVNGLRDDQLSPVHCAAAQGHAGCLSLLLTHGGNVNITDQSSWTPLHWSAFNGHYECCKQLLKHGADRTALSNTNWTPCHMAVHSDNVNCLDLLLTFMTDQSDSLEKDRQKVIRINDKDGWTLAHHAASKESHDCLSVILSHCDIDLMCTDLWGRSVLDVSSSHCHQLLMPYVNNERLKHVTVELCCTGSLYAQQQPFVIGQIQILPNMDWKNVDTALNCLVENYFSQIDRGLRTKKTSRLDPEVGVENTPLCLGLTSDSILGYSVGSFSWIKDGSYPDISPQEIMCNNNIPAITVNIKGSEIENDSLAFDLLLPVSTINNYVRLLDQYKCVVFYGPEGTRKKQLVKRLARHVSEKESMSSCGSQVVQVYLHRDYTFHNFVKLLKTENCLLPVDMESERPCILLLFHLEKVQLAHMLGSLLDHIDFRGNQHTFNLPGADGVQDMYYFAKDFYLIATMDKPRSTGLDLGLQQRFRWVQFRINVEPVRNLLARHFLRRLIHTFGGLLPSIDSAVFKAVEWLVCVWQRLNDGVSKLGLPDVVFGPDMFLPCPIESQDAPAVLDWLTKLWNETISPVVRSAVLRGTGKDGAEDGQQKVANTALFVLMQRTIVPGCPVTGDEKDKYLSAFSGSNELDISLKMDKASPDGGGNYGHRRPLHKGSSRSSVHITGSRPKHRNSTGTDGSVYLTHGNASVKRRSLSENTNRTEEVEIPIVHQQSEQTNHLQAKVPKLEIRSPVLGLTIPLPNTFSPTGRTSPLTSMSMNSENSSNHRRATFSSHSRIPQPVVSSKRSRSSENLNNDSHLSAPGGGNQFRPTSPFSFSLTTPTSSLFSFKFIGDESGKSKNLTSSPKIVNSALKS